MTSNNEQYTLFSLYHPLACHKKGLYCLVDSKTALGKTELIDDLLVTEVENITDKLVIET